MLLPCELALLSPREPSWKRGLLNALTVGKSSFNVHDLLDTRKFTQISEVHAFWCLLECGLMLMVFL